MNSAIELIKVISVTLFYLPSNKPSMSNMQCVTLLYVSAGILRFKSQVGTWRNLSSATINDDTQDEADETWTASEMILL